MTTTQKRIKIAEACGWKWTNGSGDHRIGWNHRDPAVRGRKYTEAMHGRLTKSQCAGLLPDYFNDLNAMHEAEKALDDEQSWKYRDVLQDMVICTQGRLGATQSTHFLYGATAAQRAEALGLTLNLWSE